MAVDRTQVREGMEVVTSDDVVIGSVEAVQELGFRVSRPFLPDVNLPYAAIHDVTGRQLRLGIPNNEVDHVDWPNPPVGDVWPEV